MRSCLLASALAATPLMAQTSAAPLTTQSPQAALTQALVGRWTGTLEYRDYSEPAASLKRVFLPTWLTIAPQPQGVKLFYTYDDGPHKTVTEQHTLVLDFNADTYTLLSTDAASERYNIAGLDRLKSGYGTLTLTGTGTDNRKPAEIRITWTVDRNLLSWLEEVRPAGSTEPFVFRHRYTLVRAEVPAPPS